MCLLFVGSRFQPPYSNWSDDVLAVRQRRLELIEDQNTEFSSEDTVFLINFALILPNISIKENNPFVAIFILCSL